MMQQFGMLFKLLGNLLILFSLSMLPPMAVSLIYKGGDLTAFIISFFIIALSGLLLRYLFRHHQGELKTRDGFLVVLMIWTTLSLFGAIPFLLAMPHITVVKAIFESVSGFTTTGSTIVTHFKTLSHALLYYRQQIQFLGGMGIILMVIAIMPMLDIGGMQAYQAEITGPMKNSKLRPRIAQTAKTLWYIYVGLVIACALSYWLSGMSVFDAICESFSTISTGGFSIHGSSFAFYHSPLITLLGTLFMFLGGVNFT